mgnify:CR=1 FL=1
MQGECERAMLATYEAAAGMAELVQATGRTLSSAQGRVIYLGEDTYGILGLVDASECPPTYNAMATDVQGFLDHGYDTLLNKEGDLTRVDPSLQLSWAHVDQALRPGMTPDDLVVFLLAPSTAAVPGLAARVAATGARVAVVRAAAPDAPALADAPANTLVVSVQLPALALSVLPAGPAVLAELAVKLVLNAATTGGHVLKGKVMGNYMIDLQVSNNKLFYRATSIVASFSGAPLPAAREALIKAIHQTSAPSPAQLAEDATPISEHIRAASAAVAAYAE